MSLNQSRRASLDDFCFCLHTYIINHARHSYSPVVFCEVGVGKEMVG